MAFMNEFRLVMAEILKSVDHDKLSYSPYKEFFHRDERSALFNFPVIIPCCFGPTVGKSSGINEAMLVMDTISRDHGFFEVTQTRGLEIGFSIATTLTNPIVFLIDEDSVIKALFGVKIPWSVGDNPARRRVRKIASLEYLYASLPDLIGARPSDVIIVLSCGTAGTYIPYLPSFCREKEDMVSYMSRRSPDKPLTDWAVAYTGHRYYNVPNDSFVNPYFLLRLMYLCMGKIPTKVVESLHDGERVIFCKNEDVPMWTRDYYS